MMKITPEMIQKNNARTMYVKCKGEHEDLAELEAAHGKESPEYQQRLMMSLSRFSRSFPQLLELAFTHLESNGHGESAQTTRTG